MDDKQERNPERRRRTLSELVGRKGIRCTACGASAQWQVDWVRQIENGIRRTRICRQCGHRIVTVERQQGGPPPSGPA